MFVTWKTLSLYNIHVGISLFNVDLAYINIGFNNLRDTGLFLPNGLLV